MDFKYEKAGEGSYGRVMRTELPYINEQGEIGYAGFCVTKEFKSFFGGKDEKKEYAQRSVNNYNLIKDAGLKLETTAGENNVGLSLYRLSPDKEKVVMSDLEMHGWKILNKDDKSLPLKKKAEEEKIKINLDNEDLIKLIKAVADEAILASEKGIELHDDCFIFLFSDDEKKIDFIIGDFDNIKNRKSEYFNGPVNNPGKIKIDNIYAARRSIFSLILENAVNSRPCAKLAEEEFKKYQ